MKKTIFKIALSLLFGGTVVYLSFISENKTIVAQEVRIEKQRNRIIGLKLLADDMKFYRDSYWGCLDSLTYYKSRDSLIIGRFVIDENDSIIIEKVVKYKYWR